MNKTSTRGLAFFCAAANPDTFQEAILQKPSSLGGKLIVVGSTLLLYRVSRSAAASWSDFDLLTLCREEDTSASSARDTSSEEALRLFVEEFVRFGGILSLFKSSDTRRLSSTRRLMAKCLDIPSRIAWKRVKSIPWNFACRLSIIYNRRAGPGAQNIWIQFTLQGNVFILHHRFH